MVENYIINTEALFHGTPCYLNASFSCKKTDHVTRAENRLKKLIIYLAEAFRVIILDYTVTILERSFISFQLCLERFFV